MYWVAGISYWKALCPPRLEFDGPAPDAWQARWLEALWRQGLAEFAWQNGLGEDIWPEFAHRPGSDEAKECRLADEAIVPLGGGKDSLVALERVRARGLDTITAATGQSALIRQVAETTGLKHVFIGRRLDPGLARLNRQGAWNGHVPVTAINHAAMTVLALATGRRWVVFANERSAEEPTLLDGSGNPVNHQFSKSLDFESRFSEWLQRYISPSVGVFSILRRDRELAICREFSGLSRYHGHFSSCNRNFHLEGAPVAGRWCRNCPKCRFVFLGLAPFVQAEALEAIFGGNLLADPGQESGFRELMALDGAKPFECVGEAAESRAALAALARNPFWARQVVVRTLGPELEGVVVPELDELLVQDGPHRIPERFLGP